MIITRKVATVIPARLGSTRLPGKMLLDRTGKALIVHTYEAVRAHMTALMGADAPVVVASDNHDIVRAVEAAGGRAVITGEHPCGTHRVWEVYRSQLSDFKPDLVLNVQGDEPEIGLETLRWVLLNSLERDVAVTTAACQFANECELHRPSLVKVVLDFRGHALYFSRAPIPWQGGFGQQYREQTGRVLALRHLGVYCYRPWFLDRVRQLHGGILARMEGLEQLTWLESGMKIIVTLVDGAHPGVDTEDDYRQFVERTQVLLL